MTWWMYALLGSLVWGLHYNFISKAMTVASPLTTYILPSVALLISIPFWYKEFCKGYATLFENQLFVTEICSLNHFFAKELTELCL